MPHVHRFLATLTLMLVLGCAEETEDVVRKKGPLVERLDGAFESLQCPPSLENEPLPASQVELARMEGIRAKVDATAAFRSAHTLRLATLCGESDDGIRTEAAQAYRVFRSQVARSVLGASRTRATGDRKAERAFLTDLIELVRPILPEDAAMAERRVRQIDLGSRPR